jgi:hypothetical protein
MGPKEGEIWRLVNKIAGTILRGACYYQSCLRILFLLLGHAGHTLSTIGEFANPQIHDAGIHWHILLKLPESCFASLLAWASWAALPQRPR